MLRHVCYCTIRKRSFWQHTPTHSQFLVGRNIEKGLYDPKLQWYNDEEFKTLDSISKHDRDYDLHTQV